MADHLLALQSEADPDSQSPQDTDAHWSPEQLCAYISWARRMLAPVVTPAAKDILQAYFQHQRAAAAMYGGRIGQERVTVRLLEAMVRLSQAHARLLGKAIVTAQDATAVVLLIDSCAHVTRLLSQIAGGGGGGGWGLCRSFMIDTELEQAQRSLLERLDLEQSPPSEYKSEPLPLEPVHVFNGRVACGPSHQDRISSQHRRPQSSSLLHSRVQSAVDGPSQRPRGLLARKIGDVGGGRISAPAPSGADRTPTTMNHGFRPQVPRAPSAPAIPGHQGGSQGSSSRQFPASGGVPAPPQIRSSAVHQLQPTPAGGSHLNVSTAVTAARQGGPGSSIDGRPTAPCSQQNAVAGQHYAAAGAPVHDPKLHTSAVPSGQPMGGGQAHDRMNHGSCSIDRAPVIPAAGVAQARSGTHSACDGALQRLHGSTAASHSMHNRGVDPRVGSAPAVPSAHVLKNVQNQIEAAAQQSVGMEVVGQKRTLVRTAGGPPPGQVRASAPALRFPVDDEEVDITGLL